VNIHQLNLGGTIPLASLFDVSLGTNLLMPSVKRAELNFSIACFL